MYKCVNVFNQPGSRSLRLWVADNTVWLAHVGSAGTSSNCVRRSGLVRFTVIRPRTYMQRTHGLPGDTGSCMSQPVLLAWHYRNTSPRTSLDATSRSHWCVSWWLVRNSHLATPWYATINFENTSADPWRTCPITCKVASALASLLHM